MNKKYIDMSMKDFADILASESSMPGGGSAAAYSLALSNSLASMVANLTTGKKKYAEYEDDIRRILDMTENLKGKILAMVDEDAEAFLPLAAAYRMPSETDEQKQEKKDQLQRCLKEAARVPIRLLGICSEVLDIHDELLEKGSKMLISDVGVGVETLRAAAQSARLNILININSIEDCEYVEKIKEETDNLIKDILKRCDRIYSEVLEYVGK